MILVNVEIVSTSGIPTEPRYHKLGDGRSGGGFSIYRAQQ